jgi:hypothetical protein
MSVKKAARKKKGGRKKMPAAMRRVKIAPSLTRDALAALLSIAQETGETQADVICRLLLLERRRLDEAAP